METLNTIFGESSPLPSSIVRKRIQEQLDKMARFSPTIRFILVDSRERKFTAERWNYLGDIRDWIDMGESGSIDNLARWLIPKLGIECTQ
jgi:hypothetical protein